MADRPEPFAFAQKDAFFALPREEQPPHIWECLQYLEWRRGHGDVPDKEIDRNRGIMRNIALDVAKHIATTLTSESAWKNAYDPRWPRFHPDSKDPLYLTGCHPPLLICVPEDDQAWKEVDFDECQREFADWSLTPAGMHSLSDDDRAQISADADAYDKKVEAARKAQAEAKKAAAKLRSL